MFESIHGTLEIRRAISERMALGRPHRQNYTSTYSVAIKILAIHEHWFTSSCFIPLNGRNLCEPIHKTDWSGEETQN